MRAYAPVVVAGALGASLSEDGYEEFRASRLPLLLLALNVVGAVAHGTGVLLVRTLARTYLELPVWHHLVDNVNTTEHPVWGEDRYVTHINPSTVITAFFALSLGFHVGIAAFLGVQHALPDAWWTQWYMWGLYHNMAPWRWCAPALSPPSLLASRTPAHRSFVRRLEYFFSAPLMLLIAAPLLGIRELHAIAAVVGSLGVTILFGWMTEIHGTGFIEEAPEPYVLCGWRLTRRWAPGSWRTRFQIHFLGYFPYALCWGIVFDRFRLNMEAIGDMVPDFVNVAIVGSFTLFTFFGLTQLLHQLLPYGPSLYWLGEVSYVVLSFAAKANLGFIVLFQSLVDGGLYDNVLQFKVGKQ